MPRLVQVAEFRATLAHLASVFEEGTVIGDGSLKDYRAWERGDGPGRPSAIDPADFSRLRERAIADLRATGQKPTRPLIAQRLHIGVRTLYDYDHRVPGGTSGMRVSITAPGFRIKSG